MVTWFVDQSDIGEEKSFTLKQLLEFSKKPNTKVVIRDFCIMQGGGVVKLFK